MTMTRFPNGIHGGRFYQKSPKESAPLTKPIGASLTSLAAAASEVLKEALERLWHVSQRDWHKRRDEAVPDEGHEPPWFSVHLWLNASKPLSDAPLEGRLRLRRRRGERRPRASRSSGLLG